jgi:hypothetical protein
MDLQRRIPPNLSGKYLSLSTNYLPVLLNKFKCGISSSIFVFVDICGVNVNRISIFSRILQKVSKFYNPTGSYCNS